MMGISKKSMHGYLRNGKLKFKTNLEQVGYFFEISQGFFSGTRPLP